MHHEVQVFVGTINRLFNDSDSPAEVIRSCFQKFPDWVNNEINNNKHSSRSNPKGMAAKLTRLTHKIATQLHLVTGSCTIYSSRTRRPVRKLLDTPTYSVELHEHIMNTTTFVKIQKHFSFARYNNPNNWYSVLLHHHRVWSSHEPNYRNLDVRSEVITEVLKIRVAIFRVVTQCGSAHTEDEGSKAPETFVSYRNTIPPLPHYAFMAWCLVNAQGQLYLYL